jgi:hypothetical protein
MVPSPILFARILCCHLNSTSNFIVDKKYEYLKAQNSDKYFTSYLDCDRGNESLLGMDVRVCSVCVYSVST